MFKWPRTYVRWQLNICSETLEHMFIFRVCFSYLFNQIAEEPLNSGLVIIKEGGCIKTTSFFFLYNRIIISSNQTDK